MRISVVGTGNDSVVIPITLSCDATIADVIETVLIAHSKCRSNDLLSTTDPRFYALSTEGHTFNTGSTLTELELDAEILLELRRKPDIELLFNLFDETEDTKYVFGYESYAQFKDSGRVLAQG